MTISTAIAVPFVLSSVLIMMVFFVSIGIEIIDSTSAAKSVHAIKRSAQKAFCTHCICLLYLAITAVPAVQNLIPMEYFFVFQGTLIVLMLYSITGTVFCTGKVIKHLMK